MKNSTSIFIAFFLFCSISSFAQAPDTLRAKINYRFTHVVDTTKKDQPYKEQMILLLGQNSSLYLSMDKVREDEERKRDIAEQIKNADPAHMSINVKTSNKTSGIQIYLFNKEKKMIIQQRMVNNYLIEEALPMLKWKISKDTLTIAGLSCQKAFTHYKGRDYIAWFCQDLPFQSGPWKLSGLPGLIVEAYDTKKEVQFTFDGFEQVKHTAEEVAEEAPLNGDPNMSLKGLSTGELLTAKTISLPKNAIRTTQKEFDRLKDAARKDPQGFINSSLGQVKVTSGGNAPKIKLAATGENIMNPIELPERK
jgi:GLPGLI family protein